MKWLSRVFLFLAFISASAQAEDFDYSALGRMPVLESGRIKPLDSVARVMLKRIHASASYEGLSASGWLAELFFTPEEAMKARMFKIASEQAAAMLGLGANAEHLYSFEELATTLASHRAFLNELARKDKSRLSGDEAEVARIYSAANDFAELIGSFSLLLPMNNADEARLWLNLPKNAPVTFFDIQKDRKKLANALQDIMKRKGDGTANYTPQEKGLAQIVTRLSLQETLDQDNALLRVVPPSWGGDEWLSPWGVFKASVGSPGNAAILKHWRKAAFAYRAKDATAWNEATNELLAQSLSVLMPMQVWRLDLEYDYHRLGLLDFAVALYAFGLVAAGLGLRRAGATLWSGVALLAGLMLHATALVVRMLILMRPPVSTLYESLIFVSFLVMAASCWLGYARRNPSTLLTGGLTAFGLLLSSWVFAGDSDTLGVLVAVLNTNFWLATHVVCITTGYGASLVTGATAHLYLFRRTVIGATEEKLKPVATLLHRMALIALLFTATGTMLGGIWADQSWGRFWGWDPKENGALLIVLWLIWLLHGRIAGQLNAYGFAAWAALINVVVATAWIGVNLLSVGLHSYGFTDTAANGLVAFCSIEFTFVAVMALLQKFGQKTITAPTSDG